MGRENNKERILAYNIGVSMHDIYFGARIYKIFEAEQDTFKYLAEAELCEPKDKFWL